MLLQPQGNGEWDAQAKRWARDGKEVLGRAEKSVLWTRAFHSCPREWIGKGRRRGCDQQETAAREHGASARLQHLSLSCGMLEAARAGLGWGWAGIACLVAGVREQRLAWESSSSSSSNTRPRPSIDADCSMPRCANVAPTPSARMQLAFGIDMTCRPRLCVQPLPLPQGLLAIVPCTAFWILY